jgi:NAD(P)-dependent dehydrogenase (short-subunit alcohol dehydrogenase family)
MATSDHDLAGLRALVTGATSGIGRAVAGALARGGAEVLVHGRNPERGAEVVTEVEREGGRAAFIGADLGDWGQLRRLADDAGEVDVLVNNAGFSWFGPTADMDVHTFDSLFASNVRAPYFLVAAIAPRMAAKGGGSIINIGSMAGEIGIAGGAAYGATKATMAAMARSWAAEFSPHGVRVNTVAAGPTYTPGSDAGRIAALGATTLLGRAAEPDEIAEVVAFLASPRAGYITGATVAADAGRTAI